MFILAHLPLTPSTWTIFHSTPTSYLRKALQHGAEIWRPHFIPPYIGVNLRREIKIAGYHRTYYSHVILSRTEHQPTIRLHLLLPSSGRRRRAWRVHIFITLKTGPSYPLTTDVSYNLFQNVRNICRLVQLLLPCKYIMQATKPLNMFTLLSAIFIVIAIAQSFLILV
jgi:hypothetical protein